MAVVPNWHGIDLEWAYGGLLRAIVRRTRCGHRAKDALHDGSGSLFRHHRRIRAHNFLSELT